MAGAVLLAVAGINPGVAYGKLLNGVFGQVKYVTWSVVYAAPLILTGLSVAFSFRTGVFNIGAEGQFVVGSIAACVVGIVFHLPAPLHIFLCIVAAVAAGALWGVIVGFLKVKRGINEVLSYIMFNWIAFYLSNYIVNLKAIRRVGGGEASQDVADTAASSRRNLSRQLPAVPQPTGVSSSLLQQPSSYGSSSARRLWVISSGQSVSARAPLSTAESTPTRCS